MATPHRTASMDALRRNALSVWPGMTIFWIGDLAHQGSVSGHNPDDYSGVRAEMLDADTDPEVRALDFMIGPAFSVEAGARLVKALISGVDKLRLYYVIYRSTIYRRATNFRAEPYGGANHNDHVHVSGHSSDDANGTDWLSVLGLGDDMATVKQDDWDALIWRVHALVHNLPAVVGGPKKGEVNQLAKELAELEADVESLKTGGAHTHELGPAVPADG
jgi:hypothetical protein